MHVNGGWLSYRSLSSGCPVGPLFSLSDNELPLKDTRRFRGLVQISEYAARAPLTLAIYETVVASQQGALSAHGKAITRNDDLAGSRISFRAKLGSHDDLTLSVSGVHRGFSLPGIQRKIYLSPNDLTAHPLFREHQLHCQ